MTIDKQRIDAVQALEEMGFVWNDGRWVVGPAKSKQPGERLTLIDLGDQMYERVLHHGVNGPGGNIDMWLAEAWDLETGYISRRIQADIERRKKLSDATQG